MHSRSSGLAFTLLGVFTNRGRGVSDKLSSKAKRRIRFMCKWFVKLAFIVFDTTLTIAVWEYGFRDWWLK